MFKQTVDLKQKMEESSAKPKRVAKKPQAKTKSKASEIDRFFSEEESPENNEFKKISRPVVKESNNNLLKNIIIVILLLAVLGVFYLFTQNNKPAAEIVETEQKWYLVKLINDEIFYGRIGDTEADPVIIESVYYNYDQDKEPTEANTSLRLVKRGKETHGGDGTLSIIRSQLVYLEPLREDSKVLKAIDNYEN